MGGSSVFDESASMPLREKNSAHSLQSSAGIVPYRSMQLMISALLRAKDDPGCTMQTVR